MTQPDPARMSDGERALQTQLRQVGLPDPMWEYPFSPPRKWRFDAAWPSIRLAVEVEGGTWVGGHVKKGRFEQDAEKYAAAQMAGWMLLRFSTEMVEDGRAVETIQRGYRLARVWSRTERGEGCWLWRGALFENGYGAIREDDHTRFVHRLVYEASTGTTIPKGEVVDHLCHNADLTCPGGYDCPHRRCVRPDHIDLTTRGQNVRNARPGMRAKRT